jgi:hypothetical protein
VDRPAEGSVRAQGDSRQPSYDPKMCWRGWGRGRVLVVGGLLGSGVVVCVWGGVGGGGRWGGDRGDEGSVPVQGVTGQPSYDPQGVFVCVCVCQAMPAVLRASMGISRVAV